MPDRCGAFADIGSCCVEDVDLVEHLAGHCQSFADDRVRCRGAGQELFCPGSGQIAFRSALDQQTQQGVNRQMVRVRWAVI